MPYIVRFSRSELHQLVMSDWEDEYDESGRADSKPSRVHTAPCTQWRAASGGSKERACFGEKRGGKVNREGPQWRKWREREGDGDGDRAASARPLTLTLNNSFIGRVIGKPALWTCSSYINNINNRLVR